MSRDFAEDAPNPYFRLTAAFNRGRLRALVSSGQACVYYRLAMVSKDGDWLLREDQEALDHVLRVLDAAGARYRLGAPLALPWLRGGWSAHFELAGRDGERLRADFTTRPPRIAPERLARLWAEAERRPDPVVAPVDLIAMKMTMRLKDYPFIGSLALRLEDPRERLRYSRSPRDLAERMRAHPDLARELAPERPLLAADPSDEEALAERLDAEARAAMRADARRMARYQEALKPWAERFRALDAELRRMPLLEAHRRMREEAEGVLPVEVGDG